MTKDIKSFFDSPHCRPGGPYCAVCRMKGEPAHRLAKLAQFPGTPVDGPDWDCPKGVAWGEKPRDPVQTKCVHLGEATGETVACKSCKGNVMVKLFDCSLHGNACLGKAPDGFVSCATCGDYKTE